MSTKAGHWKKDACDIYVGNPFVATGSAVDSRYAMTFVGDPIAAYEERVRATPVLMAALWELRGKTLGCWCVRAEDPQPMAGMERCHAEVLVRLVEEQEAGP